jgi:glucose/arabinose dehydrogenase
MRRPVLSLMTLVGSLTTAQAALALGPDDLPALATEVAFPNLKFNRPVAMAYPADGSNRLFVVEQHEAKIWSFPNQADTGEKKLFLQLPDPISKDNEEGLLGLAFHPKYRENGQFFVYYSADDRKTGGPDRRSVVSRFTVSKDDPLRADPASEQRIWVGPKDPFGNHNGGCIEFGPDGFLYISLGDSGHADDPLTTGQNPKDFFGSILRIDVDHAEAGKAYAIPADNPARRDSRYAHWAPEVFCIGLRNVWKFTFDRATGDLWAGDVGQNKWEMVHLIKNGGNYGWSVKESFHNFKPRQKVDPATPISPPIVEYPHAPNLENSRRLDDGKSITGGYVYRGKAIPELVGVYVYGDFDTGRVWGLRYRDRQLAANGEIIDLKAKGQPKLAIAAFGEDAAGELYLLAFAVDGPNGRIHRLVPRSK